MRIELLIIDPQNDFCWPGIIAPDDGDIGISDPAMYNPGALFIPGAYEDMTRLAGMIDRLKHKIDDIHVTMDSHHFVDIGHPIFWRDSKGKNPDPFTIITKDDLKNGIWRSANPQFQSRAIDYVTELETNGRYPLCVWPPHCLIGTYGYGIVPPLAKALLEWEKQFAMVDYVTKGSNLWTEHYSAVQADVPDPQDPDTQLNMRLINTLQDADIILLAGEAKSHCLANTVIDVANNFGEDNIKKMVLLEDATSNVPDPPGTNMFTDFGDKFVEDMKARGMQVSTTVDFLK